MGSPLNLRQLSAFFNSDCVLEVDEAGSITKMLLDDGTILEVNTYTPVATREDYLEWRKERR